MDCTVTIFPRTELLKHVSSSKPQVLVYTCAADQIEEAGNSDVLDGTRVKTFMAEVTSQFWANVHIRSSKPSSVEYG
ncbi:hypothetical protein CHS0354_011273 [Potamilus streckersoni]|uniref:Uncharacterized protein n=1 Tax=Potamilus streckersoni TaxID=2493646 RepID=A0AAE0RNW7_9BIVA|nr:hypothetical protein CHS0354_011273 [Potamilus streckersoni]